MKGKRGSELLTLANLKVFGFETIFFRKLHNLMQICLYLYRYIFCFFVVFRGKERRGGVGSRRVGGVGGGNGSAAWGFDIRAGRCSWVGQQICFAGNSEKRFYFWSFEVLLRIIYVD